MLQGRIQGHSSKFSHARMTFQIAQISCKILVYCDSGQCPWWSSGYDVGADSERPGFANKKF